MSQIYQCLNVPHRYLSLKKYFNGINVEDLKLFTADDILDICSKKDKMLMKVFVQNHLIQYLSCKEKKYYGYISGTTYIYKDEFERLYDRLSRERNLKHLYVLNCSNNKMEDGEILFVSNSLSLIPYCHTINLSNNNLNGTEYDNNIVDTTLAELLSYYQIQWIIITGNVISTTKRKDLYVEKMGLAHLKKLIFLTKEQLQSPTWREIVNYDTDKCKIIEHAHSSYYGIEREHLFEMENNNDSEQKFEKVENVKNSPYPEFLTAGW